jgi:S-DNA-T family DNA segregation ATPase FtsK/SpoIIIE
MSVKANRLKNESEETPTPEKKPRKEPKTAVPDRPSGRKFGFAFVQNENVVRISGLFFLLFSLFLTFAFVSHLFHWQADYDKVKDAPFGDFILDPALKVSNAMGKFGALFAFVFFHNWFGIASFIIPFFLFLIAFRMFFAVTLLPIRKTFVYSLFSLIYISLTAAFLFSDEKLMFSGGFGYHLDRYLNSVIGATGVGFILLFSGITFCMLAFKWSFKLPEKVQRSTDAEVDVEPVIAATSGNSVRAEQAVEAAFASGGGHFGDSEEEEELEDESPFLSPEEDFSDSSIEENVPFDLPLNIPVQPVAPVPTGIELTIEGVEDEEEITEEPVVTPLVPISKDEGLSEEDKARMNLNEVLSENEEFDLGDYDPTLDLSSYRYPELELLENYGQGKVKVDKSELEANSNRIIETLKNYNIEIARISASIGPTVTLYEIVPAAGVRISKIKNLEDDIALSLSALGIRIIAPMPGKGTIGIEVPNQNPEIVAMRSLLASDKFVNTTMDLPIALGKTISNENFVADLAKMPHLLMAGATGQGKSVGLNAILVSLLYKKHPSQIKFVLVDPKKVELTLFNKIERHFLAKLPGGEDAIITDTKKVVYTLNSLCILMDQRYELLKMAMVRNIKEYNAKFLSRKLNPKNGHHFMPYIVLVVDEFADLIMTAGKEVEIPIARLAQLARAIGIHLIIATQRPSVNIITGTIKANFPARIAFRVTSKIDSRTILDAGGAEQLIGRGDMLLSTGSDLIRLQCPFVDTPEVDKITAFIGDQRGYASAFELPEYIDENADHGDDDMDIGDRDSMFEDAAHIVVMHQQGSASLLQRKLKLGYNRAGRIIDQLEKAGIIGPFEGSKARKVLIKDALTLEQYLNQSGNE